MRTAMLSAAAVALSLPAIPAAAAQHHHHHRHGPPPHAKAWGKRAHDAERYYAERHYRSGYRPIRLRRDMRVYRGYDGRYYCRRSDGTTGLIVGAALGGLLGNQLGRGDSTLLTTVIGAGAGGLIGREIDRGKVVCR
ncbi:glycine zipper 2TM domain-containing protein [Stakelama marina]|uniref:17 kDa surface antigen n=1 Tax=Stakelama marina TaxID=2826939 RepID=A0A8T4IJF1_9SPHN|nr:glycine zipper 2TM domain-containing protein [Stakelama marina]MBR0553245.1 glycine zipper 2TM domain-containing protein [Stakelama marina]